MSVLIKGVSKLEFVRALVQSTYFLTDDIEIIEVPTPHGRLIDSEKLSNMLTLGVMTAKMHGSDENTSLGIHFMKEILKEMSTVIEEEL